MDIYRPKRVRVVCAVAAVAIVTMFTIIGIALTGAGFRTSDKWAMIGLGLIFGAGIMVIARPSVRADSESIKVQNIIGGYELPWQVVRKVRFDRGQPWVYLDLEDDDTVAVLAVQAVDKERALEAVRHLRSLHAQRRAGVGTERS
jgi:hypothetical protein